ncbi:ATP-binding protein [Clostridium sp. CM028]|uniref:ATP-binding protein n=1 Tax=unclassified Clostridium TaxID=2614128 RepID=UPI001C0BBA36|nr:MULTISPECIES: ATP-binding protein [unclassified Clostridium]MBU3091118.1 ATP-binding protein [Clostridium sp. CF011]MBW9144900.1 ATP-binding protein [Clostridium sp. CM027]MBW9148681.1 ATP-binding protein [Clostridium sp. CM028]UVE40042.1 ATP-binding protein [Clostridium sp. CM027]WAG68966.1 ATP-binding protein [Clostridium sp. CF011]
MIKGYQTKILAIYDRIRQEEEADFRKRKVHIEKTHPEIIELDHKIGKLCIELSISALKSINNRDEYLHSLKEKIIDLRMKKSELLVSNGFDMEYLNLHYRCTKCRDTGFIGNTKCPCFKQKVIDVYYTSSELQGMLNTNNFDNFKLDYYPSRKSELESESPKKNIEKILSRSMSFLKNFNTTDENLLFYGSSGTGKTFLSHCITKELLDKGSFVVYRTAEQLIKALKEIRFNGDTSLEELLINCDLLIIDDLGTEQISDFTKTEMFNLLNTKLLKQKKMLVSTNLTLENLLNTYTERITSRLIGNFTLCKFFGDDIRIKKNLSKSK